MRLPQFALLALIAIACSDGTAPPGGQNTGGGSLAIQSGNNQEAAAATYVAVQPAVIVKNAQGAPVSGVTVTFSVAQGGGSVISGSATTASDGIARVGAWKLGPASGVNQLRASAAGLTDVVFTATANAAPLQLATAVIPPAGGTITVNRPGNPLNGLTLTIPAGSFTAATTWEFYSTAPDTIPGRTDIGFDFSFEVKTDAGFAEQPLVMRIPIPPSEITGTHAMFMYLPGTTMMDGIPSVTENGHVTLVSRHFSTQHLAAGFDSTVTLASGSGKGLIAGALTMGPLKIGGLQLPDAVSLPKLDATPLVNVLKKLALNIVLLPQATNVSPFRPGADDWEFPNHGSVVSPFGQCAGQSQTAIWYFLNVKPAAGPLFRKFDEVQQLWQDNRRGIRWTGVVQLGNYDEGATFMDRLMGGGFMQLLGQRTNADAKMFSELSASLMLTNRPEMLAMYDATGAGHAVIAYGVAEQKILIADPNYPGQQRLLSFANGQFQPYNGRLNGTSSINYTRFMRLGMTTMMNALKVQQAAMQFFLGTIGNAEFPASRIEWKDGSTWRTIQNNRQVVWVEEPQLRAICPTCPKKRPAAAVTDQQWLVKYDANGFNRTAELSAAEGTMIELQVGSHRIGAEVHSWEIDPTTQAVFPTWVDFQWLTLVRSRLSITPANSNKTPNVDITFTAVIEGEGPANPRFEWTFGDGQSTVTTTPDAVVRYAQGGVFPVTVKLFDNATGLLLTTAETMVTVVAPVSIWRITSLTITGVSGTVPHDSMNKFGLSTYYTYFSIRDRLALITNGSPGFFHYHDGIQKIHDQFDTDLDGNFMELIDYRESAWIQPGGLSFANAGGERAHYPWQPSIMLGYGEIPVATDFPPLPGISSSGGLASGTITGRSYIEASAAPGPILFVQTVADFSATKALTTLTGTMTLTYRAFVGSTVEKTWSVTYSFTGTRL